jgi:hypothetical protein
LQKSIGDFLYGGQLYGPKMVEDSQKEEETTLPSATEKMRLPDAPLSSQSLNLTAICKPWADRFYSGAVDDDKTVPAMPKLNVTATCLTDPLPPCPTINATAICRPWADRFCPAAVDDKTIPAMPKLNVTATCLSWAEHFCPPSLADPPPPCPTINATAICRPWADRFCPAVVDEQTIPPTKKELNLTLLCAPWLDSASTPCFHSPPPPRQTLNLTAICQPWADSFCPVSIDAKTIPVVSKLNLTATCLPWADHFCPPAIDGQTIPSPEKRLLNLTELCLPWADEFCLTLDYSSLPPPYQQPVCLYVIEGGLHINYKKIPFSLVQLSLPGAQGLGESLFFTLFLSYAGSLPIF